MEICFLNSAKKTRACVILHRLTEKFDWRSIGELEHGDVFAYYRGVGAQRAIAEQNRDL